MTKSGDPVLRVVGSMADFSASEWGSLDQTTRGSPGYNPFVSHAFLSALEQSGSASAKTGWRPQHLRLESGDGQLLGAAFGYAKSHSQGEYVFDHGWADAFERAGGRYYPKLQYSVPFTPATGPRLLVAQGQDAATVRAALAAGMKALTGRLGLSSAHVTFLSAGETPVFAQAGFLARTDQQFHFVNQGYATHDDFLGTLASRKRKALKKERRAASEAGIDIVWLSGADLTEAVWDDFFAFYVDTGSRKWGRPYLTREFFSLISQSMADDIVLVMAKRDGRFIAGALNFVGADAIYGRHWGCIEDHPFLHFELCYHQAIDYAIAHKLARVEAGAQGQHKLARGYGPVTTHSAHWIEHPGLRNAVADYLEQERREVARIGQMLEEHLPFRKT
jgi:predicted N-acyltransferase